MLSGPVLLALPTPAPPPAVRAADVVIGTLGGVGSEGSRLVLQKRPGGLILFGELRDGGGALRVALRRAHLKPVLMIDQEGGSVRRVRSLGPAPPSALRLLPASHTQREYRRAARGLRKLGVDVNLAPVADVDTGGTMGFRSFGSTPKEAGKRVVAAVRGLHAGGVAGCVKHFPGLGNVGTNTDAGIAIDRRSKGAVVGELAAFSQAIDAGARCVMVSSVVVPALCSRPAVLCKETYRRLRRMGFRGVIVTDSLDADALRPYGTVAQIAVKALGAGADSVLMTSPWSTLAVIDAVARATKAGRLDRVHLRASALRLRALR
jgi:beta-N-acetylhexosaminidase